MLNTDFINEGLHRGLIQLDEEKKIITYVHQNKRRNFQNPEEQVQAEAFLKLVIRYQYPVHRITLYETVTIGSRKAEADMVVYDDNELHTPLIVVECKREEVTESEFRQAAEQAFSYAISIGAKYVWTTSDLLNEYYQVSKDKPRQRETIADIPYFGDKGERRAKYYQGGIDESGHRALDLSIVNEEDLTRRFKQAHDALWGGGELNPSEAFDELDKLIFCKIWDERNDERKDGQPYDFQIFTREAPTQLQERMLKLYAEGRKRDPEVFRDNIRLNPERLRTVVRYLQEVNLSKTDLDSKGRAFETFLGAYFRGEFGQYFTPRVIVEFTVNVLPINNRSMVLDTSCGSGGFLLFTLDKIRREADERYGKDGSKDKVKHYKYWHDFAEKNLYGIEINEQISRTAKMNMIIHDDGHTNVIAFDGLYEIDYIREKTGNKGFAENHFDFIVTNPPFGSIVKQSEKAYMQYDDRTKQQYYEFALKEINWIEKELKGKHLLTGREAQSTEVLFIEQCHRFLKPGGYLGMVVPDGILTNSSLQYVRDGIEEKYRIVAVVSMPQTAFTATGAGVKSSVLFLRKHDKATTQQIRAAKLGLQKRLLAQSDILHKIEVLENERTQTLKKLKGFRLNGQEVTEALEQLEITTRKELEKSEAFKEWKAAVNIEYTEKINALKEDIEEQYQSEKQQHLLDYPVFMSMAEDIGYDATGRKTNRNDLPLIAEELKRFIDAVNNGTDSFFA